MSDAPNHLKYTKSHEWIRVAENNVVTIGITDHAQSQLGDIVFVELPEVDLEFNAGTECAVVESVKAASDLYSPVTGKIIAVNEELEATPELLNSDPYEAGWIFTMELDDTAELDGLISSEEYLDII